jgi:hypothetical protein
MTTNSLKAAIYAACLQSARAMKDIKALSWFGKNSKSAQLYRGK